MIDGTEIPLYKCNRVIATKNKSYGMIYKYKVRLGVKSYNKMPNIPDYCKTINEDLKSYNFDDIKKELDYMYYVERTYNILDISWKKLTKGNFSMTDEFKMNI